MDDAFWRDVSYVQMSKNRREVLQVLATQSRPMTPSELAEELDVVLKSASRAVRQLADRDLVKCINPDDPSYRRYRLTEKGADIANELTRNEGQ